ncbi:MAG: S8 family serine peptidase [Idiomarina sp.]|nr:S8 family serine peptidase [Idiomarina sp.]
MTGKTFCSTLILCTLLCSVAPVALSQEGPRVPPLPRPVDRIPEHVIERQAERATRQVERAQDRAEQAAERAAMAALLRGGPAAIANQRLERIPNLGPAGFRELPAEIIVRDQAGRELFRDIEVRPGVRVIEREWVLMISPAERSQLRAVLEYVQETETLGALDLELVRLRVPAQLNSRDALQQVLPEALWEVLEPNYVYSTQLGGDARLASPFPLRHSAVCSEPVVMGVIDTAIDTQHPLLESSAARIVQRSFTTANLAEPLRHGTAVAGVLLGEGPNVSPLLPVGQLLNASVFYAQDEGLEGAALNQLLSALNWMAAEGVQVINMSLTGPDNRVLARAVNQLAEQEVLIIAAAGNGGPSAAPAFPAAYPAVIAVTATDRHGESYRWANHGDYIEFSAWGVDVPTAIAGGRVGLESGTSMAAPVVAALLACQLAQGHSIASARSYLRENAYDLGAPGVDPVFGFGLVTPLLRNSL